MYLKTNQYMLWHYRAHQPSDTTLPPSPLQVEELFHMWCFLVLCVSTVSHCGNGCQGLLRPSEAAWAIHSRLLSMHLLARLWVSGTSEHPCHEPHWKHSTDSFNTAAGHVPWSCWFTGTDRLNLFHFIILKDISPVIRMLLFPCCPFAVFLLRGRKSTPITFSFFLLETFAISNPATGKMCHIAKEMCWITVAEFSVLKCSHSSEYDWGLFRF